MASLGNFDANQVNPDTGFEPLPAGDYVAMILDSDMKPTKNGAGEYLELSMQVIDGPYNGRLLWDRLTLDHPNNRTVEIAQRKLSAICHAVGVMQPQDSAQLHSIPIQVRLKYIEDPQYGPKNEVSSYKSVQGQQSAQPAFQPQQGAYPQQTDAPFQAPQQQSAPAPQHQPQQAPVQQAQPFQPQQAPAQQAPAQQAMPWGQQPQQQAPQQTFQPQQAQQQAPAQQQQPQAPSLPWVTGNDGKAA